MQVNLALQLLLVILSCGGAGLAIAAILLPHWITYHHHSRFWERTNVQTMGIFGGGRLAIALRDEHGNKPVDLKLISEGRWTSYAMQCVRTAAWTSAAGGSLAAFLSIWQSLRFGSDKSIPCVCLGLRCVLLLIAAGSMSVTTALFVYIVWPLLLHKQRLQNSRREVDEELHLDVSVYLASSAVGCQIIALFLDLLLICCYRNRRTRQNYHERRATLRRPRKMRHPNRSCLYKHATSKWLINKSRRIHGASCSSIASSGQSDTTVKGKSSRTIQSAALIGRSNSLQQLSLRCNQSFKRCHYRSKSLQRKAPAPSYSTQSMSRSQRAQSESAHDSNLMRHKRRAPIPPVPSKIMSIASVLPPPPSISKKWSHKTLVSCSNSSLDSSRSSHGTLL